MMGAEGEYADTAAAFGMLHAWGYIFLAVALLALPWILYCFFRTPRIKRWKGRR